MTIRVDVTAGDIARGVRRCGVFCPVFLAASRAVDAVFGHPRVRRVSSTRIEFANDGRALLPAAAIAFIADLDAGRPVVPFAFDLE